MFRCLPILGFFLLSACEATTLRIVSWPRAQAEGAAPVIEELGDDLAVIGDAEMVRAAAAGAILNSERAVAVSPTNELVLMQACKAHLSYAYGWLDIEFQAREDAGDYERADPLRRRLLRLAQRAKALCFRGMNQHSSYFDSARAASLETFESHVQSRYQRKEDTALLFWTALAWVATLQYADDGLEGAGDLSPIRVLAYRAAELDPGYMEGLPLSFAAAMYCVLPDGLGGDCGRSKRMFEEALAKTKRRNLGLLVTYARTYALNVEDQELYRSLLTEVVNAPDLGDDVRLQNDLAHRNASYFLSSMDKIFY